MKTKSEIRELLQKFPQYNGLLFCKGFLITNADINEQEYPFDSGWLKHKIGGFRLYHDNKIKFSSIQIGRKTYFMIGHAYNPFTMTYDENEILRYVTANEDEIWEREADLTGVYIMGYISDDELCHWGDCACMYPSFYGTVKSNYFVTSHCMIVADNCNLKQNPYITELINYKYFKYFGNVMPADLSPFSELRRTVPNHYYTYKNETVTCNRFYPIRKIVSCKSENEYHDVCEEIAEILRNNLTLIFKKWPRRVALSLTGGKDSKTSLASAKQHYNKFFCFSYISKPEEAVDAEAAKNICNTLGIEHRIYQISDDDDGKTNAVADIIAYNLGNTAYIRANESRKRKYLCEIKEYDVEIKSWISELGRAYQYKRYKKDQFSFKPTPRQCTTLYKFFITNRELVHKTDKIFKEYIEKFINNEVLELLPEWTTLWGWEFDDSANGGLHLLGEQMLSHTITVPYNNRHLIELFLKTNVLKRAKDEVHDDIIKINNLEIYDMNINIVNVAHTWLRAIAERLYYEIHSRIPF